MRARNNAHFWPPDCGARRRSGRRDVEGIRLTFAIPQKRVAQGRGKPADLPKSNERPADERQPVNHLRNHFGY